MFLGLDIKKVGLWLVIFLVLLGSYFYFSTFRPKSIRELKEVKSATSSRIFEFVYPADATQVGSSETELGSTSTFETNQDAVFIHKFYKNVFDSKGWESFPVYKEKDFYVSTYKLKSEKVKVTSSFNAVTQKTVGTLEYFESAL